MNAPVERGAAGFLARYQALRGVLPGDSALRAAAADAFRAAGLPGGTQQQRRTEAWKYTSLRPLAQTTFQTHVDAPDPGRLDAAQARLPRLAGPRLVFVDGQFCAPLSQAPAGFARFADQPDFGTLTWPDREPMVALNTMLAHDGAALRVRAGTDAGLVQLVSLALTPTAFHPRHAIHLEAGARLTVLEVSAGNGRSLNNTVIEVHVGTGAALTHVRLQDEAHDAFHVSTIYARVADGGTYDSFTLNLGSQLARTELRVDLAGPGATAHLNGAQLLAGIQHADFTTVVRHVAPRGTSRQTVKNVLAGRSRGVFQGRIEVARAAQKTDGYQMNQALLLSPDAEIDTKPELEIFADDVKCSHGATVGELDSAQLFYLQSRGVPEAQARSILVRAFLAEALDAVTDEAVRGVLEDSVEQWWRRQAA